MDPIYFLASTLLNVLGFGAVLFISRQGKGGDRQQMQGETLASLSTKITGLETARTTDIAALRREVGEDNTAAERRFSEMEGRLERHLTQVDTRLDSKRKEIDDLRNGLSRLETIVENLAKTVERLVERDERSRQPSAPATESLPDVAMLRALALLLKNGGDLGKAASASH